MGSENCFQKLGPDIYFLGTSLNVFLSLSLSPMRKTLFMLINLTPLPPPLEVMKTYTFLTL